MARSKTQTVGYFPHPVKNGTRMFIMEQRFGDKGYCCYYKLLEMLGSSEGHYLDFKLPKNIAYFSAILRSTKEETMAMLDTLCELEAIDFDLWNGYKTAWSQEFVDHLDDLYSRRKVEIPTKKWVLTQLSGQNVSINPNEWAKCNHDVDINPQSKVNESKVNESKVNKSLVFESLKKFFGFEDEIKHINKWSQISSFIKSLEASGRISDFEHQFYFYKKYKDASGEKKHRFDSFIEGGWDSANWEHELKNLKSDKKQPEQPYSNTGKNYRDGLPTKK